MRVRRSGSPTRRSRTEVDPSWIGIGFSTSDGGFVFLIITSVLVGVATRRLRRDPQASPTLVRVAAVLTLIPLARLPGGDLGDDHQADLSAYR